MSLPPCFAAAVLCASLAAGLPARAAPPLAIYGMESKPICFTEDGRPAGLAVDLARLIQDRLGQHDAIEIVPWARANTLTSSMPNVLLLTMVRTPERERALRFVGPIFNAHIVAFALRERLAELRRAGTDLHGLRAGARRGSAFVGIAQNNGYRVTDETNSSDTAARMLVQRRFDLWFEGEEIAGEAIQRAGLKLDDFEVALRMGTQNVNFAFSVGTPEATVQAWDAALRELKRDGSYQKLHRKWLPNYALPADAFSRGPASR